MFKDNIFGLDYRDASIKMLYLIVLGIIIPKKFLWADFLVFLVKNKKFLSFINRTINYRNHHTKFEIYKTIGAICYGKMDVQTINIEKAYNFPKTNKILIKK